jgi:DnaJ-class molecular chaperone
VSGRNRIPSFKSSEWDPCEACHNMGYRVSIEDSVPERCKTCGGVGYVKPDRKPAADPTQPEGAAE